MQGSSKHLSAAERSAALQSFKKSHKNLSQRTVGANSDGQADPSAPNSARSLGSDTVDPKADRGMVLPFEPVIMTFR